MSLQVWLPFTDGTLKQQGLSSAAATNGGTVNLTNAGKLGKCATLGTAAGGITLPASTMTSFTKCSVAFWVKIISWNTSYATLFQAGLGSTPWNNYIFGILRNNANSNLCFTLTNSSSSSTSASYVSSNLEVGQWYHLAFVYNTGVCKIYINGVEDKSYNTSYVPNFAGITHISIGRSTNGSNYQTNCSLNDFRIYDHALSPMEVKWLSQGLVLHYPLNRNSLGPTNLIRNGFGEFGTENWTNASNISTTNIPSGQTDIKASFTNNSTKEHIKIYQGHTYKFSAWIKAAATSGNTYPSLYPYDIDGKFISTQHCREGFNLSTMTTLKQQLKAGDTKIYVNDLSQWNANSGHYYNVAAIFSYTDGTGYTYPDGMYTQNCPAFGTGTNAKTNLDKTNNIITLNSAYTGPTMPVGTKICASTYGSTYFYPLGGINLTTIQDWTYKENTFSGSHARLENAKTVIFSTYSSNYMAGIKLQDLTNEALDGITEYDCSGFCNNGTRTGTFSWTSDTPKYSASSVHTGSNYIYLDSPLTETQTIAVWVKWNTIPSGQSVILVDNGSGIGLGLMSTGILCSTSKAGNSYTFSKANLVANTWYHFVIVKTGTTTRKLYINGVEQTATSNTSNWTYSVDQLQLGKRSTTSDGFAGKLCDFRAYATALSAEDVKSLYQNCATIDPDGTIRGQIRS